MSVLVLSCEHASNRIPEPFQFLFEGAADVLDSHRGIDFGAYSIALAFQKIDDSPFFYAKASRLLVDLNRSIDNPGLFSEYTDVLSIMDKQVILDAYYSPYRQAVFDCIADKLQRGERVFHLSVHSFTDHFVGQERRAEIGLLYDPARDEEQCLAHRWRKQILKQTCAYRVRMNYPYLGVSDGFVTHLRKHFTAAQYVGVELEVNQALSRRPDALAKLSVVLYQSLALLLQSEQTP